MAPLRTDEPRSRRMGFTENSPATAAPQCNSAAHKETARNFVKIDAIALDPTPIEHPPGSRSDRNHNRIRIAPCGRVGVGVPENDALEREGRKNVVPRPWSADRESDERIGNEICSCGICQTPRAA